MMGVDGPADLYLEATDQHRGWFQSSLITSVALNGRSPYKECLTHGFVVDVDTRKKISKSQQGQYAKPTEAEHFVNKHGADIVRLWVAQREFHRRGALRRGDVRAPVGNVPPPAQHPAHPAGQPRGLRPRAARRRAGADFTFVDRWIMHRLQEVIATCREAYAAFEFHKVYHTLNQFCAVDLSSLYVDITKDRMYCDRPDSPRRRATQTVMHRGLRRAVPPARAAVPVHGGGGVELRGPRKRSVHLELFPDARRGSCAERASTRDVDELLAVRAVISQAVEAARQEKIIGNALEAEVTLHVADAGLRESLAALDAELEEFFILSDLKITEGAETPTAGRPPPCDRRSYARCERCWRHPLDGRHDRGASHALRPLRGRGIGRTIAEIPACPPWPSRLLSPTVRVGTHVARPSGG